MGSSTVFALLLVCAGAQAFQMQSFAPFIGDGSANQNTQPQQQQTYQMPMQQQPMPQQQLPQQLPQQQMPQPQHGHQPGQGMFGFRFSPQNFHLPPQLSTWFQNMKGIKNVGAVSYNVGGFNPFHPWQNLQAELHHAAHDLKHLQMVFRTPQNFYEGCGTSVRFCDYRQVFMPKAKILSKFSRAYHNENDEVEEVVQPEKPKIERFCNIHKVICVGNTEHCVSKKDCDVALRITEKSVEGRPKETKVVAVSGLDRCHWDGLSNGDDTTMGQRYVGVGFAAYDANQQLKCRALKASDFKLIFLQKNVPSEFEGDNVAVCKRRAANDTKNVKNAHNFLAKEIETWPALCQSLQSTEEGAFNLKSFLKNHVAAAKYTKFFSPPFDFADNFETQTSANGMMITGSVNEG